MKKLCVFLVNLFLCIISYSQQLPPGKLSDTKSLYLLEQHSIRIRSIDPSDDDFSDLAPLKGKIGNSRLVVLGEDTHGDGETEKAKIRLIKFLHEQMGFSIIAWEFNYSLDGYINTALVKDTLNLVPDKYYGFGWDADKPLSDLIAYTKNTLRTRSPMTFAGFDFDRPPAGTYILGFLYHLGELHPSLSISEDDRKTIDSLSGSIHGFLGNTYTKSFSRNGYTRSVSSIRSLHTNLVSNREKIIEKIDPKTYWSDSLLMESLLMDIELDSLQKIDRGQWNKRRDEDMAIRITWLLEKKYPGEKIIIWSATAHLIRNSAMIRRFDSGNVHQLLWTYKQAGDYLAADLGNEMYTIAFTSHNGQTGVIMNSGEKYLDTLKPPEINSYEDLAHKTNQKYLFTDLRSAPAGSWLSKEFMSYPLGYNKDIAQWKNVIDAFFFIDQMRPVEHRPLSKKE
jgi:erythromycin esterase